MDITQVVDFIMTCNPEDLSTINDAFSDRLDQLFWEETPAEETPAEEAPVEEAPVEGAPAEAEAMPADMLAGQLSF